MEFMHSCLGVPNGRCWCGAELILIKYWFSVSDEEQERRFQDRMDKPTKRWKLSPMDLESRKHWADYSRAKDEMFAVTDTKQIPWYVVNADDKKCARLNVIRHLLSMIPYRDLRRNRWNCPSSKIKIPRAAADSGAELHSGCIPLAPLARKDPQTASPGPMSSRD